SGECNGTEGIGVVGWAGATTGGANGVFGYAASPAGAGVVGQAAATTGGAHGVYGTSAASEGRGVTGVATAVSYATAYGVHGINNSAWGAGVYGYSNQGSADGVLGENGAASGNAWGVYGRTASTQGWAVYGFAHATTGSTRGVCGRSDSPSGYGVYYQGGLAGSGTKSCVVRTSKGPSLMYCQESPENWFEDFGEGTLVDGRCHIELDPVFLETVTVDAANPMKVFVTPQDPECEGLAALPLMSGFDVVELRHGVSSGRFTYRVVAKRSGFEAKRLDVCETALTDSYLYPELKEKEREEEEARSVRRDHAEEEYQHPHTALMPVSAVAP
ncbi:hypothetical protein JXA88_02820, partial [Candidatus Fermentibacteria bacterium]|nr:hypothetical protein [Candidatus Fermentibacteria bacterium]